MIFGESENDGLPVPGGKEKLMMLSHFDIGNTYTSVIDKQTDY